MRYDILTIRTAEHSDGSLYPVLGDENFPIELEPQDSTNIQRIVSTALTVSEHRDGSWPEVSHVKDVRADLIITDARLAVACSRYDKGGGWYGVGTGALVAVGINAVSKSMASHRRKGKLLVGHIRYPWLVNIGAAAKTGFTSTEALRLTVVSNVNGTSRMLNLTCNLPNDVKAAAVAQDITRRAARYRLSHAKINSDEERSQFEALASAGPLKTEPKKFVFYNMPSYFFVSPATAYPAATAEEGS